MNRIELDNRRQAVKLLKGMGWDAMPVENKAHDGTPDLNAVRTFESKVNMFATKCVEIWVEFKIVEEWPKKRDTPIRIRHFTPQQKAWFKLRIAHNSNCFIIVQIEEEHFLYKVSPYLLECLGTSWTKRQMHSHAHGVYKNLSSIFNTLEKGIT